MTQRMSFLLFVAGLSTLGISCQDTGHNDAAGRAVVPAVEDASQVDFSAVESRQHAFLQAIATSNADPSEYMSRHFTFRDRADSADAIGRAPGGMPNIGVDYLGALSNRLLPAYAEVSSLEMVHQRPDEVVVITRHPGLLPAVTRWELHGGEWKAMSLVINVDEGVVAALEGPRVTGS